MSDIFRDPNLSWRPIDHRRDDEGGPYLRADREPCIICGHPTGDCGGASDSRPTIAFADESTTPESLRPSAKILVEQDVFEERQITPFTKITVRLAKKGSYVTFEKAKKLGIIRD